MASTDYKIVHKLVLELITEKIINADENPENINADTNLFQSGILDSFDFLDLIAMIEENSELSVDLAEMDGLNIAVLGDFIKGIVQQNSNDG
jgi:acyl carrier protein